MWIMFAFSSAFFAGITAILAKCGIRNVDSNTATALRTIVVLGFSWLMVFITGAETGLGTISGKTMAFLICSGVATGGSWLCYFRALQLGTVNQVTPIDKSSTILTMLLACLFLNEGLNGIKFIAMSTIAIGTYLMIQKKESIEIKEAKDRRWLFFAFSSAVFASLTSILGKIGMQEIDSNLGTAIRTFVVLIMAWIVVFVTKKQNQVRSIDAKSWIYLMFSGISTGASWLCYYRALQTGPASIVVPIDKLSILVTIAFSRIILKEKISKRAFWGLICIVVGTIALLIF